MKYLITLLVLFSCTHSNISRVPSSELIVQSEVITPQSEVYDLWMEDIFQSKEFWVIQNKAHFITTLGDDLPPDILAFIYQHTRPFGEKEVGTLFSFYSWNRQASVETFSVSKDLKKTLSQKELNKIYSYLEEHGVIPLKLYARSEEQLYQIVELLDVEEDFKKELYSKIISSRDGYIIPITQDEWPRMPKNYRKKVIADYTLKRGEKVNGALDLKLKIQRDEDLVQIAKKYAGRRDSKSLERYFQKLLNQTDKNEIEIPLQKILHPFVRDQYGHYSLEGGPNCFNSGICTLEGKNYEQRYLGAKEIASKINTDFEILDKTEKPKIGDLILYTDERGVPVHVASYVSDDIVFTKNGVNKFNPYIFQKRELTDSIYSSNGKVFTSIFRSKLKWKNCSVIMKSLLE